MYRLTGTGVDKAQCLGMESMPGHEFKAVFYKLLVFSEDGTFSYTVSTIGAIIK
jgi:hypothetical protein